MNHDIEAVNARWQRRHENEERAVFLFATFRVGDLIPGTIAHDQMVFAIARQQLWHALRNAILRVYRWGA